MSSELNGANSAGPTEPPRNLVWRVFVILFIFLLGIAFLVDFAGKGKPAQAFAPPSIPVVAAAARTGRPSDLFERVGIGDTCLHRNRPLTCRRSTLQCARS